MKLAPSLNLLSRERRLAMIISQWRSIIKESIQIISEPLAHIINLSITYGIVPDQMKIARVVPLFKADDPSLFTNYRPVSILTSFSKFLERIIYNRILDYLTNLHILCDNQFGFRKNHSTMLALIDLHDKISSALDNGKLAVGVFLDLSKSLWHSWSFYLIG